jgi:hypothetical protein
MIALQGDLISHEGVLALIFCLVVYLISVQSLGKCSVAHTWLFSGLCLLTPTDKSVARIVTARGGAPIEKAEERLAALELSRAILEPGAVTLQALKRRDATELWKNLDTAVTFGLACLFSLLLRGLENIQATRRICASLSLGKEIIEEEILRFAPCTVLLVALTVRSWWILTLQASKSPGLNMPFLPSTYLAGLTWSVSTWFLLTSKTVSINLSVGKDAALALEELSIRCYFWVRLVGWKVDTNNFLPIVNRIFRLAMAITSGLVGFVIAEPLQTVQQAVLSYQHSGGDALLHSVVSKSSDEANESSVRQQSGENEKVAGPGALRVGMTLARLGVMTIPPLLLLSFLNPDGVLQKYQVSAAWLLLVLLSLLTKGFLQSYLFSAVPTVVAALQNPSFTNDRSSLITHPFSSRNKNLLRFGSQVSSLSLMLIILLTVLQLCPYQIEQGVYPTVYHGHWMNHHQVRKWHQEKTQLSVETICCSHNVLSRLIFSGSCQVQPNLSEATIPQSGERGSRRGNGSISSGMELLGYQLPSTTMIASLAELQRQVKLSRDSHTARVRSEHFEQATPGETASEYSSAGLQEARADFWDVLRALVFHPFATTSVVYPLTKFLLFVLLAFAVFTGTFGYLRSPASKAQGH